MENVQVDESFYAPFFFLRQEYLLLTWDARGSNFDYCQRCQLLNNGLC